MANKIGRFEILSELSQSEKCSVYKATDPESGQTVALKAVKLELLGDQAQPLVKRILEEADAAKALNSPNIAVVYGAGEMEGSFCASLEYIQGNSVATTLNRHEGFSIWDIQDITRQVCQALDHASGHKVAHYSLEPSKIMSGWDGTVKILSYGISSMSSYAAQAAGKPMEILHYMSPEQLNGSPLDVRSNIFSLGVILYEMATDQKAFPGDDADQVRQQIRETMPAPPLHVKGKVHPQLSALIMKALAKDPAERYQSGRELVLDLEKCKDTPKKAEEAKKIESTAKGLMGAPVKKAPVTNPFIKKIEEPVEAKSADAGAEKEPAPMAKAAAVGSASASTPVKKLEVQSFEAPKAESSKPQMTMSTATAEPEVEAPKIAVDPAMDENRTAAPASRSFSEISELPPLKPVFIAPPAPAPEPEENTANDKVHAAVFKGSAVQEKPKIQPKEVAKKAAAEIKKTPPKFFMYAVAGALGVILLVIVWIAFKIHSENADDDASSAPPAATAPAQTAPAQQPAQQAAAAAPAPDAQTPVAADQVTPEPTTDQPQVSVTQHYKKKQKTAAVAPAIIPGQLAITSTPQGAQVQIDGHADPSWITPYNMAGITPGGHTIVISKAGYGTETRTIDVASGSKSFVSVQMASLLASISVTSDPAGAAILLDGKDTGKVTPATINADKAGNHTILIRKQGYLDETTTANLQTGQTSHYAATLRALGSTDDIKIGGKFKKMFGGSDAAGMGAITIKTSPKGAQVAVNNRILDKNSPVDFYLNPGTYVIDVTLSGYSNIHRVVTVDKGGKIVIDESLQRQ